MKMRSWPVFALAALLAGCGNSSSSFQSGTPPLPPPPSPPPPPATASYTDATATNLPTQSLGGMCMDADHGDVDGDGDIDLALAQEFATNLVLLNDGAGVFTVSAGAVGGGNGDNEDVRLRDFDDDGDLDMLSVHEDDAIHALLYNDGSGQFSDVSSLIPVSTIANAAEVTDINNDGRLDILIGNRGVNVVLLQQASGMFFNATVDRSIGVDTTQDLLLLDIDGDTDLDVFVANESANRLFVNDGNGFFADETDTRLPGAVFTTREADAADVDNDGDLDVIVGNVGGSSGRTNQLLLNDGAGVFADATATNLADVTNDGRSFTIHFVDLDDDGDPDILSPNNSLGQGGTIEAWINDGSGNYSMATPSPFSTEPAGSAFDIEVVDVNGDGLDDLYFCYRTGTDQLYIRM